MWGVRLLSFTVYLFTVPEMGAPKNSAMSQLESRVRSHASHVSAQNKPYGKQICLTPREHCAEPGAAHDSAMSR